VLRIHLSIGLPVQRHLDSDPREIRALSASELILLNSFTRWRFELVSGVKVALPNYASPNVPDVNSESK
jgi:hypothetical protein